MSVSDATIVAMIEMALQAPVHERENARVMALRALKERNISVAGLMGGPRLALDETSSQRLAFIAAKDAELARLRTEMAKLRKQVDHLTAKNGTTDMEQWALEGCVSPLPPSRKGFYPFSVMRALCIAKLGGRERGWQGALTYALMKVDGEFRYGNIQDWQRSRRGVPELYVRHVYGLSALRLPPPHKWSEGQRRMVRQWMRDEGLTDTAITTRLSVEYNVLVTSEAVRAIRKEMVRAERMVLAAQAAAVGTEAVISH